MNEYSRDELRQIPGVGKAIAGYMRDIGIDSVGDLKGREVDGLLPKNCTS